MPVISCQQAQARIVHSFGVLSKATIPLCYCPAIVLTSTALLFSSGAMWWLLSQFSTCLSSLYPCMCRDGSAATTWLAMLGRMPNLEPSSIREQALALPHGWGRLGKQDSGIMHSAIAIMFVTIFSAGFQGNLGSMHRESPYSLGLGRWVRNCNLYKGSAQNNDILSRLLEDSVLPPESHSFLQN